MNESFSSFLSLKSHFFVTITTDQRSIWHLRVDFLTFRFRVTAVFVRGTLKMAIFWDSPIASISTPNFGPISMKLGPVVRFTKKMTLNKCGPGSGPNYGETAVCPLGQEGNKLKSDQN